MRARVYENIPPPKPFVRQVRKDISRFPASREYELFDSGASIISSVDSPEPGLSQRVLLRHNGVPGRARLQVIGLRGNDRLKILLETAASGSGIRSIEASSITGNLLVFFDPSKDVAEIVGRLEIVIREPPVSKTPERAPRPPQPGLVNKAFAFIRKLVGSPDPAAPPSLRSVSTQPGRQRIGGHAPESLRKPWHAVPPGEVMAFLRTSSKTGLIAAEATLRLQRYGANLLPALESRSAAAILREQLLTLPVLLLIISAGLSVATGGIADAVVIAAVVAINAAIGFATEYSSDRTIRSLLELSEPEATVIRDGAAQIIKGDEVVPGDVVVLRHGQPVVADARLISASRLTLDESALTGESMPVEKQTNLLELETLPLADRTNMAYRGTVVTGGQGLAIVVTTGRFTEIGKIQDMLAQSAPPETRLQKQMRRLGIQLTWGIGGVSCVIFCIGLMRGFSVLEMLRSTISLAIAAVPEGLPTVATVCLASGMRSLLRERVLARRLAAVEAIGGVQALCFDKTGTLTWNRMSVAAISIGTRQYSVAGGAFLSGRRHFTARYNPELSRLLEIFCLCSEASLDMRDGQLVIDGSPTEAALVRMALDAGIDAAALRRRLPLRHTQHRAEFQAYMTTWHDAGDGRSLIAVKGNPTEVLQLCDWRAAGGKIEKLGDDERAAIHSANQRMAARGLRVLGAACQEASIDEGKAAREQVPSPRRLVWIGLAGLADPPRHGVREVIAEFRRAGVRPLMLTGDQAATAEAVADALQFHGNRNAATARAADMEMLDENGVRSLVRKTSVFSRVSPSHKLQIVRAMQADGLRVGMTGDGVNDSPALKAADAGIAMGRGGAKVARGVADLILMDDNIEALLPAIREGRRVHENLRKAVHYIAATNASEILVMFASIAAGLGQPFNPRQLLWINLITDIFPELALALEPADPEIMSHAARDPNQPVIGRPEYFRLGRQSAILTTSAMAAYVVGLARYGPGPPASTMAFLTLTSAQLLHGLSARSEERGANRPPNPAMRQGLLAGFGLLLASQFIPGLRSVLGAAPVGAFDGLVCAGAAMASFLANEISKPQHLPEEEPKHELVEEWSR